MSKKEQNKKKTLINKDNRFAFAAGAGIAIIWLSGYSTFLFSLGIGNWLYVLGQVMAILVLWLGVWLVYSAIEEYSRRRKNLFRDQVHDSLEKLYVEGMINVDSMRLIEGVLYRKNVSRKNR